LPRGSLLMALLCGVRRDVVGAVHVRSASIRRHTSSGHGSSPWQWN